MSPALRELIRVGKVKGPNSRKFDPTEWVGEFGVCDHELADSEMLRSAGLSIAEALAEIRNALSELYTRATPAITNHQLQIYLFAASNRDRAIARQFGREKNFQGKSIFSATLPSNSAENDLTLMEVSDGCVDGLANAVTACCQRIDKSIPLPHGNRPTGVMEFINSEMTLSQLYSAYESYWLALLWGNYKFTWIDFEQKICEISQQPTKYEVAHEQGHIRRQKRLTGSMQEIRKLSEQLTGSYIQLWEPHGRRKLKVASVEELSVEHSFKNAELYISCSAVIDEFPAEFVCRKHNGMSFNVEMLLNVFRLLSILSDQFIDSFPTHTAVLEADALLPFCPVVKRLDLIKATASACGFDFATTAEIIDFLIYKKHTDDLWCKPLLAGENHTILLLVSALTAPNLIRTVEHWLVNMKVELTKKGSTFEVNLLSELNNRLSSNGILRDFDLAKSARIKTPIEEEEIDLIFRMGNLIVIGEAKSIVVVDSPISYYRSVVTLQKAAEQSKRKLEFVKRNIALVRAKLGWTKSLDVNSLQYLPIIITSNGMHAGYAIDDVAVCDKSILTAYFEKSRFPLFSTMDQYGAKHWAWFEVYENENSLVSNFPKYITEPPQIRETPDDFILKSTRLPALAKDSLKLFYKRLVRKEVNMEDLMNRPYHFPLFKDPEINERLKRIDIII